MSTNRNGSNGSNKGGATSKSPAGNRKPVNPYTKKNVVWTEAGPKTSPLPPALGANATFSQAFGSMEDTDHFRSEVERLRGLVNLEDGGEKRMQREFESQAAKDDAARLEARRHHELMQPHVLYVSTKQRGNGILKYIRNVPYAFSKMIPDYIMNTQRCALFLSIKYHGLFPNYIHRRIAELKTDFQLRVLLVLVDVEDNANALLFLNRLAVLNNMTLILAWSEEEAARYLETYKSFDGKDASLIQRREQTNFIDQVADFLGTVRSINKTDSAQLMTQFGSVKAITEASMDELTLCPGLGEKKVKRLHDALHRPFSSKNAKRRRAEAERAAQANSNDEEDKTEDTPAPIAAVAAMPQHDPTND